MGSARYSFKVISLVKPHVSTFCDTLVALWLLRTFGIGDMNGRKAHASKSSDLVSSSDNSESLGLFLVKSCLLFAPLILLGVLEKLYGSRR